MIPFNATSGRRRLLTTLLSLSLAGYAAAQCATQWQTHGYPGANGTVHAAVAWDPDGAGPLATHVILGGEFTVVGDRLAAHIVAFDPTTNTVAELGAGMDGAVTELAVAANGDLVAAGSFTAAGATFANYVARWNGSAWSAVGAGPGGPVDALTAMPNGDLVVATATGVFRWDGTGWSLLGAATNVKCVLGRGNGDVVAGGDFTTIGGVAATDIARWNGTAWSSVGGGIPGITLGAVQALIEDSNGHLVAGGTFRSNLVGSALHYVARWDGVAWSAFPGALSPGTSVEALAIDDNGAVLIGGTLNQLDPIAFVARDTPALVLGGMILLAPRWAPIVSGPLGSPDVVRAIAVLGFTTYVFGGTFRAINAEASRNAAFVGGNLGGVLAQGTDDPVDALAVAANGDIYAGGRFGHVGQYAARHVAVWAGGWEPLMSSPDAPVTALAPLRSGRVVAGGFFKQFVGPPGQVSANNLGVYDPATLSWSALGSGWEAATGGSVYSILELANGTIAAGGASYVSAAAPSMLQVKLWNGTSWSTVPFAGAGSVRALAELPNGDLLMAGPGIQGIERWDGTTKTTFATGGQVNVLTRTPTGLLVAGGSFGSLGGVAANNIAAWNGTTWSPLGQGLAGPGEVHDIDVLPNGDLLVGGSFALAGAVAASNVARWNGSTWSAVGAGTDDTVRAVAASARRGFFVGGSFLLADSRVSAHLARLDTTCPATVSTFSTGPFGFACGGSLDALVLPWVDATFRARAFVPDPALVFGVTGFSAVLGGAPLPSPSGPGCRLNVAPDILTIVPSANGIATSSMFLPNTPPLVGVTFYHQLLPVQLDALGNWVTMTSTSTLKLTGGMF